MLPLLLLFFNTMLSHLGAAVVNTLTRVSRRKWLLSVQTLSRSDIFQYLQVVGVGAVNGCTDVGGILDTDTLSGITGDVVGGSFDIDPIASISGKLSPGDRIRIEGSSEVSLSISPRV